jgi:hypothetical protein
LREGVLWVRGNRKKAVRQDAKGNPHEGEEEGIHMQRLSVKKHDCSPQGKQAHN